MESKSDEEWLVELVGLSLEKRRLRGDLITPQLPERRGWPGGVSLFSQVTAGRMRGNGFKLL